MTVKEAGMFPCEASPPGLMPGEQTAGALDYDSPPEKDFAP